MRFSVSRILRAAVACLCAFALAACATAPAPSAGAPWSKHDLQLCPGMRVSNAPPVGANREIIAYSPLTVIRGVMLARAPVDACLSSAYGPRSGGAGSFHDGLDLYTRSPHPVLAGGDGRIASILQQRGYGLVIRIDHRNGVSTRYAHLSAIAPGLRAGAHVVAGEEIAQTGRTGNATAVHLHYEILVDGRPVDPLKRDN